MVGACQPLLRKMTTEPINELQKKKTTREIYHGTRHFQTLEPWDVRVQPLKAGISLRALRQIIRPLVIPEVGRRKQNPKEKTLQQENLYIKQSIHPQKNTTKKTKNLTSSYSSKWPSLQVLIIGLLWWDSNPEASQCPSIGLLLLAVVKTLLEQNIPKWMAIRNRSSQLKGLHNLSIQFVSILSFHELSLLKGTGCDLFY